MKGWGSFGLALSLMAAAAARPLLCDLVVGRLERHGDSLVVVYQNQGQASAPATPVALRIGGSQKEILTVYDQPPAIQPLAVQRSRPIPFRLLGIDPNSGPSLQVRIDPLDQIPETNEVNNEYSQLFQSGQQATIYPKYERYRGYPDLAVDRLAFVAPDLLEATVVNRGAGVTMGSYQARFRVNGVTNEGIWVGGNAQPLPLPGQYDKWPLHLRDLHLQIGQTVAVEFLVDEAKRIPDQNRNNNRKVQSIQLAPPVPKTVPFNQASGDLNEKDRPWRAAGCFANWIEARSTVHVAIFPFRLRPSDLPALVMNDAMSVLEGRVPGFVVLPDGSHEAKSVYDNTPFAELVLTFRSGTIQATMQNLVRAGWRSGTCNYSEGGELEKQAVRFKPFALKAGSRLDFSLHDQVRGQTLLNVFPKVLLEIPFGDPLPDDVPPNWSKGIVRFGKDEFRPTSVCAFYRPAYHRLDLLLWDTPIEPHEMQELKRGWWTHHLQKSGNRVVELQVYFDTKQPNAPPQICLAVGKAGLNASFKPLEKASALCQLRAPKFGPGLPLTFRLRGRCPVPDGRADIDVAGEATMLEVR